jgi:3-oxoacyl-[acyl-carrier-protein] synthase-3
MISREWEVPNAPSFCVHAIATKASADIDPSGSLIATVRLAAAAVDDLTEQTGRPPTDFRCVLFPNYRMSSQKFMASALGLREDRILFGPIAELGHGFSADPLVTLDRAVEEGALDARDHVLVSVIGPYSWSLIDVEYLGNRPDDVTCQ